MLKQDLYKVLQVDAEADPDVISAAYHTLAAKLHPDKDLTGVHEVWLAALNTAYDTLRDPVARQEYDEQRIVNAPPTDDMVPVGPGHGGNGFRRLAGGPLVERMQAGKNGEHVDSLTIGFGRYTGWSLGAVARQDPDYLRWLSRHSSGIRYRTAIMKLLDQQDEEARLRVRR